MNLKNNYNFLIYSILYTSLLFGLFIDEDLTIGYKLDHFIHLQIIEKFDQNFTGTLLNFNKVDTSSHSPFFYIVYMLLKKISLSNELLLRIINLHISLLIPYLFYLILKIKDISNRNILIGLIPGIIGTSTPIPRNLSTKSK